MHLYILQLLLFSALVVVSAQPMIVDFEPMCPPVNFNRFVVELPSPILARPLSPGNYRIAFQPGFHSFHPDMPDTYLWTYDGIYPGPSIVVRSREEICVNWVNNLRLPNPAPNLLPEPIPSFTNELKVTTHVHGSRSANSSDGLPLDTISPGQNKVYCYPNIQPASTLFYHDHSFAFTRTHVYSGLVAGYIITDDYEASLNLPTGARDKLLLIQDKDFDVTTGQLRYPEEFTPEFFGEFMMVNGKLWPRLSVLPKRYRFRVVNGCNSRFLQLSFSNDMPFTIIGTEGGFLSNAVEVTEILMGPAQRYDILVDFAGWEGSRIILENDAPIPFPDGGLEMDCPMTGPDGMVNATAQIMVFEVATLSNICCNTTAASHPQPDTTAIIEAGTELFSEENCPLKRTLANPICSVPQTGIIQRNVVLQEINGNNLINNREFLPVWLNQEPGTFYIKFGTTEIWNLINVSPDAHPIHLHLAHFCVVDRTPITDVDGLSALLAQQPNSYETINFCPFVDASASQPAEPFENGPKDTVIAYPGEVTRIAATFGYFLGRYVYHCHILEHEDFDMMQTFEVIP